ncbi:hypothetical protein BKA65DRAFT_301821 [Rhexocercosporidium sp. MPI-PUGE-AT-0058]|nr:hypothetical protein BKA65DRAFT_301821 [Rhexocercosporidium sp. MPI-PUGE-AT-0058]
MLIHSGSGYHAHEFSRHASPSPSPSRLRSNSLPKRSPLARSAFSAPLLPPQTPTITENPSPVLRQPLRPLSENILPAKELVVRFEETEEETMSEDGKSMVNSEGSITTAGGGRRRRRSVRTSSTFHLAHPAPTLTQKQRLLQIRPKLLLQLQQLSTDARPKPSLDVLPSTVVVPRLYKKFPRMFRGKGELGCNDVMIVKSEEYETTVESNVEGSDSDEDGLGNRDLVAVICQLAKDSGGSQGKAEMVLSDGSVWLASPLPNGLFEFISTDEHGIQTTARWVRRSNRRQSVDMPDAIVNNEMKFTFSLIDPNSRRHPILATMNQAKLDIPDCYTTISPSASRHPPTSPLGTFAEEADTEAGEETIAKRTTIPIDQALRTLIQVTGVWLALRQGWSPYFKYNDAMTVAKNPSGRVRSMSLAPEPGRLSPTPTCASTPESTHTLGAVLGGTIRRVSAIGCPSNGSSPQLDRSPATPKRSVSTGTAFMQRAAARRAGHTPSTVPSDNEGESMMESKNIQANMTNSEAPSNSATTPPASSLALPGSSVSFQDTPTRSTQRPQSYIPTSSLQNSFMHSHSQPQRHSIALFGGKQALDQANKPKIGRWKSFTNLFRRSNCSSRSS